VDRDKPGVQLDPVSGVERARGKIETSNGQDANMRGKMAKIGAFSWLCGVAVACGSSGEERSLDPAEEAIGSVEQAASACSCAGGSDHRGVLIPASSTYCGFRICGGDHHNYECTASGWSFISASSCGFGSCRCSGGSDDQGRAIDPNATECGYRVCGSDHQFYDCKSTGWTGTSQACSSTGSSSSGGGSGGPVCLGTQPGAYCGNDNMQNASASTLYQCPGAGQAPTSSQSCPNGCVVAPAGSPDFCQGGGGGNPSSYRFPWPAGTSMQLTQDCNDACCGDHVGSDKHAWDFANGGAFNVVAARAGTVTHLKINSNSGCGSSACVNDANFIVIDHGDGTQSTYLHLAGFTLGAGVTCGASVQRGQRLATAGSTGWSTGTHLHYEVSKVHAGAPTCECGSTGQGCAASSVPWSNFWSSATYPTVAITFTEWAQASQCGNRRMVLPASQN
jgi:hypothetical protein